MGEAAGIHHQRLRQRANRRGLRPPDLGEDRALRRLQPARREGRVVELRYYPGTEEAHTNPTRQRGECLRALAGASG